MRCIAFAHLCAVCWPLAAGASADAVAAAAAADAAGQQYKCILEWIDLSGSVKSFSRTSF